MLFPDIVTLEMCMDYLRYSFYYCGGCGVLRGGFLVLLPMLLLRWAAACWKRGWGASNGDPIFHILFVPTSVMLSAKRPRLGAVHQAHRWPSVPTYWQYIEGLPRIRDVKTWAEDGLEDASGGQSFSRAALHLAKLELPARSPPRAKSLEYARCPRLLLPILPT